MQLDFQVGVVERHTVAFNFNQFWGGLTMTVDGEPVVRAVRFLSISTVAHWEFTVGDQEQHHVRIEKHRPRVFAGFRPQTVKAFIDGELAAEKQTRA